MTLLASGALYLLLASGGILFLYFLRTRSRRQDVSDLFLWEGLESDARSRAAWIRARVDPLLLLELLVLALFTLALAGPALLTTRPRLGAMAIVLDGSASMRSRAPDGVVRYDLARRAALDTLQHYRSTPTIVIELSSMPRVLSGLADDRAQADLAVSQSQPTWFRDGTAADLLALLDAQGGTIRPDRVFWFGDRSLGVSLPGLDETLFPLGDNLAITEFQVRADADGSGSTAFVRLRNDGASYRDGRLRVTDGTRSATLPVLIPPDQEQVSVLPLPGSFGPAFVASVDPKDAFPDDDTRYVALPGRVDRRVRWLGEPDRYLLAALQAAVPITVLSTDDPSPADLTVVSSADAPADLTGSVLLVHAGLAGLIRVGQDIDAGDVTVLAADDPLLSDVDPTDFRVRRAPALDLPHDGETILSLDSQPFLWRYADSARRIVLIGPDLLATNLPLTVDFPLLVRNALRWLSIAPTEVARTTVSVGATLSAAEWGTVTRVKGPNGEEVPLSAGADAFVPAVPGIYAVTTDRGTYVLAANLDPVESQKPEDVVPSSLAGPASEVRAQSALGLWPYVALLALLALVAENLLYRGASWRRGT